ncbi:MAG: ATP-binding protein [Anaerolineae bacterium]
MLALIRREIGPWLVAGHSIALLLVIGLGIFAVVRLNRIGAATERLTNQLAVERALADDIVSQVALVRFYASKYVRTQKQADLDRFDEAFARLQDLLARSERHITNSRRFAQLRLIEVAVQEYSDGFQEATQIINRRQAVRSHVLNVQELEIDNKLAALRVYVNTQRDPALFLSIGNAQKAFSQMRLNALLYLNEGDERYNILFDRGYQGVQAAFANLEATLPDPTQRENAAAAAAAATTYAGGFQAVREDAIRLRTLFQSDLARLEITISDAAMTIAAGVEDEFQAENRTSQGLIAQTRFLLLAAAALAILANFNMSLVTYGHITRRLRAEEALRRHRDYLEEVVQARTAELQQRNEEIKQFAYIVSHDLRAPLVNLKGFAAELRFALNEVQSVLGEVMPRLSPDQQRRLAPALQEDVPEALDFIDVSVNRTDGFLKALLKLSRLGRVTLNPEPVDVNEVVQETLTTLAHQLEARQIQVTVDPLPEITADRTALEQIFGNLLDNAVKYLDPARPDKISITAQPDKTETTFIVRDNGRGIAPEDMGKVFAPFRRAGRQDAPGEGMGLPYVQTLIRRHGGDIHCQSQPGVGTTFTFTLANQFQSGETSQ